MRLRIRRSSLRRDARFSFGVFKISLLCENPGEIQPGRYKVRPETKSRLKMTYGGSEFPLLRQYPSQGGLRLGVPGRAADSLFEICAGENKVAFAERFLAALVGEPCG